MNKLKDDVIFYTASTVMAIVLWLILVTTGYFWLSLIASCIMGFSIGQLCYVISAYKDYRNGR